jgi:hypothetical protein
MEAEFTLPEAHLEFAVELLNVGHVWTHVIELLVGALMAHGMDEDEALADLAASFAGSIGVHLESVPAADLRRAAELLRYAEDAIRADLQAAEARTAAESVPEREASRRCHPIRPRPHTTRRRARR